MRSSKSFLIRTASMIDDIIDASWMFLLSRATGKEDIDVPDAARKQRKHLPALLMRLCASEAIGRNARRA